MMSLCFGYPSLMTTTFFEPRVILACWNCCGFFGDWFWEVVEVLGIHLNFCFEASSCFCFGIHFYTSGFIFCVALTSSFFVVELSIFFFQMWVLPCFMCVLANRLGVSSELSCFGIGITELAKLASNCCNGTHNWFSALWQWANLRGQSMKQLYFHCHVLPNDWFILHVR